MVDEHKRKNISYIFWAQYGTEMGFWFALSNKDDIILEKINPSLFKIK